MTCNLTNTPLYPEPLPLYSRHDPDAVSIHSAAPSYVSEAPTYTSRGQSNTSAAPSSLLPPLLPNQQTSRGLPAPRYAPGFQSRAHGSISDLESHNFNIGNWSSVRTSHASRQYQNVARRRANQTANTTAILNSLSAVPPPTNRSPNNSSSNLASSANAYPVTVGSSISPVSPLEDPYLVGEEAAGRARRARVYREMCLRGEETAKYESRSWEFMLGQMSDWDERAQSWKNFRSRVGNTKLLGRRLGFRN